MWKQGSFTLRGNGVVKNSSGNGNEIFMYKVAQIHRSAFYEQEKILEGKAAWEDALFSAFN